jgi:hypothetical protein
MGKKKESRACRIRRLAKDYADRHLQTNGKVLHCTVCDCAVACEQKSQVDQHVQTARHLERAKLNEESTSSGTKRQAFLAELLDEASTAKEKRRKLASSLCETFIAADIPLQKLNHPRLRQLLFTLSNQEIPDESTIRKYYLHGTYELTIQKIRDDIGSSNIYVQVDETCDKTGRMVANVVVGKLCGDKAGVSRLLNVATLERTNQHTVAKVLDDSLAILWPTGVKREKVTLLVSDAAAYMKACARGLRESLYPSLLHVTCIAHALHRVCDTIRALFDDVDLLIANSKKVFLKAPARIRIFREVAPELPLPPEPVVTRWGTWISAARYYASNYETICQVFERLEEDAEAVRKVKRLLSLPSLPHDLAFLSANYGFLPHSIDKLQASGMQLTDSMDILEDAELRIRSVHGKIGEAVSTKLAAILEANSGLQTMKSVAAVLRGEQPNDARFLLSPTEIETLKFAPLTSCDTERTFSQFKNVLRSNRESFVFENLRDHLIVHCNRF